MADKKISALTASTTPLSGTEVLPIVQSGSTVKVSVANLTAGRTVQVSKLESDDGVNGRWVIEQGANNNLQSATTGFGNWKTATLQANPSGLNMTWDTAGNTTVGVGNLVIGTAGKGIDFSAATHAAGMTSELLNDYEEGTFTPTIIGATSAGTGTYSTQTGTYTKVGRLVSVQIILTWTAHTGTGAMKVAGLPFTVAASVANPVTIAAYDMVIPALTILGGVVNISATTIELLALPVGGGAWSGVAMDTDVPALVISGQYFV